MIAPKIVEFSKTYPDVRFYKFDIDELPDIGQDLNVTAMPTFLIFKDGEKIESVTGANPRAVESAIQKGLAEIEADKLA